MTDFLANIEHLFSPIDAWGEFRRGARPAAVAFVLFERDGAWKVPFVRRRADLPDHPGQVELPGGGVRAGEAAWDAAQREVAEEIGVPVGRLIPLGAGEPLYAAVTNFSVVPFVAYLPDPVESFVHDERELEGVLAIALDRLLDDSEWLESDTPWRFRHLSHHESRLWGPTQRLGYGLPPPLRQAPAEGPSAEHAAAER